MLATDVYSLHSVAAAIPTRWIDCGRPAPSMIRAWWLAGSHYIEPDLALDLELAGDGTAELRSLTRYRPDTCEPSGPWPITYACIHAALWILGQRQAWQVCRITDMLYRFRLHENQPYKMRDGGTR